MSWEAVIGLEIHVQLKTRTKMFCRCAVGALDAPNTRTCPICLAHPGTLPVPNRQAVEWTIRLGLALGCEIAEHAVFHRKNYFYPDNPKGYQISQYDEPLCIDGLVRLPGPDGVAEIGITRAHLEEDAAKTLHVGGAEGRIHGADRVAGRLQPRRHAARRDRHRARHPHRRAGAALPAVAPSDGGRARDLGRGDGEGIAPLRCQRQRPPGRIGRAAHAHRAEEHELVRVRRTRNRARDRAADRDLRIRRAGRAGDASLRSEPRGRAAAPLQGGGGGLPLLPGTGSRADRAAARVVARRAPGRASGVAVRAPRACSGRRRSSCAMPRR